MHKIFSSLVLIGIMLSSCNSKKETEKINSDKETIIIKATDRAKSLQIVHQFNVPPQKVFDAFTKPRVMKVWLTETTTFDIDLSIGGLWTIIRTEGTDVYTETGKYLEIEKPNKLVYTYGMPQFSLNKDTITIEIVTNGENGSTLTFTQKGIDIDTELNVLEPGSISQSEEGWRKAFELIEKAWGTGITS